MTILVLILVLAGLTWGLVRALKSLRNELLAVETRLAKLAQDHHTKSKEVHFKGLK